MLSSRHNLLFIKRMRLIRMAFYEPDLDRLESMWSPDIFGEMMATNNAVMHEDRISDKLPALVMLSGSCERQSDRSSQLVSTPSCAQTFVGVVMCHINAYPLSSAYSCFIYHYKRMRILTRLYTVRNIILLQRRKYL